MKQNSGETIATSAMKIGTVTFMKENTGEFAALGHSTIGNKSKKLAIKGICYDVELERINKGAKGEAGSIVAMLDKNNRIGHLYFDSNCGIFGRIDNIAEEYEEVETACWYNVKKGNANIIVALGNEEPKSYEVEIVGIDYIDKNKNIKIKILDDELIEKTGGIIQGMSGTPLMQDGKLIGAVNYVSTENPDIAYAIFVDKLL